MRLALRRLLLLLTATGICLLVLEVAARAYAPVPETPSPRALLRGGFVQPGDHPNRTPEYTVTVHVNAHGFVDTEWPDDPPDVVLIGDSYVQAAQVPLNAGYGRKLAQATGLRVESMGVPGAGTATALGVLRKYALPRRPRVVLLGFLVGNDVLNNSPALDSKDDKPFYDLQPDGTLALTSRAGQASSAAPFPWLWHGSALWRLGWQQWAAHVAAQDKIVRGNGVPIDFRVYDPNLDPAWAHAWHVTTALVAEMSAVCAHAGVTFGVVLLPDAVAGTAAAEARMHDDWPITAGWDPALAHAHASEVIAPIAPVFDLLPAVRAAEQADPAPLYLTQDGHWTARGHQIAALATAPFVRTLLPPISACEDESVHAPASPEQESP